MDKTKIDWCDSTWNVVTGCVHDCEYCYARGIANRFGLTYAPKLGDHGMEGASKYDSEEQGMDSMLELIKPYIDANGKRNPYPMAFAPTFHRYRLDEYKNKSGRTIFVCSMADLFGNWVPDEWLKAVFIAASKAPQHRYLYLTKNPERYCQISDGDPAIFPDDDDVIGWFGASASTVEQAERAYNVEACSWLSIEPIQEDFEEFCDTMMHYDQKYTMTEMVRWSWIVIGAETGNRKNKVIPERSWIENIAKACRDAGVPVFMKESLREMMGADFVQEFPWKGEENDG